VNDPRHPDGVPAVAIILVNWNGWRDTVECIDSLLLQDHGRFHVFVVDNASNDDSITRISAWCAAPASERGWREHDGVLRWSNGPAAGSVAHRIVDRPAGILAAPPGDCRVTLIQSGGNLGFAGGCNVAVRAAGLEAFDHFWFLNNDTVVARDALSTLVRRACAPPRPGITGSTIAFYDAPQVIQVMGGARMDVTRGIAHHIGGGVSVDALPALAGAVEDQMAFVMGASMLVSREFVAQIGMMQEDYFLYFEEIDWAIRGRGRFSLGYAAASRVYHKAQASGRKAVRFSTRFFYRNRIRFASRYYPEHLGATKRGMLSEMLRHLARGRWTHVSLIAETLRDAGQIAAEARSSGQHGG